jgi:hypothetical protein
MGFTKLDSGIVLSSVWSESLATRVVWITLLAMKDFEGKVLCSRQGLMRSANVPKEEFDEAIRTLESPDEDSRSVEYEGRRIEKIDGGWIVLNHFKYRAFSYSNSKDAIKKRLQRDKKGTQGDMSPKPGDISVSEICNLESVSVLSSPKKEKQRTITVDPDDERLTNLLIELILSNNLKSHVVKAMTDERKSDWINHCRLLRESDGHSHDEIELIIKYCQKDSFWRTNILSMHKLREKWDQLWLRARRVSGAEKYDGLKQWLEQEEKKDADQQI